MRRITAAEPIPLDELLRLALGRFRDFVKGVVDLKRGVLLIDALGDPDWIEFDSMINLRPSFGNRSRVVDDAPTQDAIRAMVASLVRR